MQKSSRSENQVLMLHGFSILGKWIKSSLGWRRKGILRVISPKCGGKWRPYPSPITDEENARFVRQLTQYLYSQSVVGLWHIWFRYSGNPMTGKPSLP